MDYGKYIIVDCNCTGQAVLFDNTMSHDDFLSMFNEDIIVSAGMFIVSAKPSEGDPEDIEISVFGESITLGLKVRIGTDERFIKRVLRKAMY